VAERLRQCTVADCRVGLAYVWPSYQTAKAIVATDPQVRSLCVFPLWRSTYPAVIIPNQGPPPFAGAARVVYVLVHFGPFSQC